MGLMLLSLNIRGIKMDVYKVVMDINYILKWSTDNTVIEAVPIKNMPLEERKDAFIDKLSKRIAY